jgi:GntR family transcriptional repressor for pyruvate dehydrogenase complex
MIMEPIKRASVTDSVVDRILGSIAEGELKPGQRLPSERELTQILEVSRSALREAFKRLEMSGVLVIRHGDGTYVNDINAGDLMSQSISSLYLLDHTSLSELIEAREFVEVKVAGLAARKASDSDTKKMMAILDDMGEAIHDPVVFAEKDFAFHLAIAEAAKNSVLTRFFLSLSDLLREQQLRVLTAPGAIERAYDFHKQIAKAIVDRDPDAAQEGMHMHLTSIPRSMLTELSRRIKGN